MNRLLLSATFFLTLTAIASAQTALRLNEPVGGDLAGDRVAHYVVDADSNSFVAGIVDQQSVDVVVTIHGPGGTTFGPFDGPGRGPEPFHFIAASSGRYTVDVAPFKGATGHYVVSLKRLEPVAATPQKRVDQLMWALDRNDGPGVIVAVAKDGEIIYSHAYGMADLTHSIPLDEQTISNIGSISKQFTALGILLLQKQGLLSIDDPVSKYIPGLPAFADSVRIRNLLTHTSGFREVFNTYPLAGWVGEDYIRREDVIDVVRHQPALQNPPGSAFNYCNTGFIMLADIIHRVTGKPFAEWMKQNIFEPLGMRHTQVKTEQGQVIAGSAFGYAPTADGAFRQVRDLGSGGGAGGVYTTVGDLNRWINNFRDPKVGTRELLHQMETPAVLTTGDTLEYGFGIFVSHYRGTPLIEHGGADGGFRAELAFFPRVDGAVILLSNSALFSGSVYTDIADAFFGDEFPEAKGAPTPGTAVASSEVHVPADLLARYAGSYLIEGANVTITYTVQSDQLMAQVTGQPMIALVPTSDSTFTYSGVDATVTFHRSADGSVDSATHVQGVPYTLRRTAPYAPVAQQLQVYAGRYYSPELETFYTLEVRDDTLRAEHRLMDTVAMLPQNENQFFGGVFLGEVEFERDGDGRVTAFTINNGRTRGIKFEKLNREEFSTNE